MGTAPARQKQPRVVVGGGDGVPCAPDTAGLRTTLARGSSLACRSRLTHRLGLQKCKVCRAAAAAAAFSCVACRDACRQEGPSGQRRHGRRVATRANRLVL